MKAVLGALALLSFTATAAADWELVTKQDEFWMYADTTSIRTAGHMVKMWSLSSEIKAGTLNGKAYRSSIWQYEYDCHNETSQMLYFTFYSKKMGQGRVIFTTRAISGFVPEAPGTVGQALWETACARIPGALAKGPR